MKNLCTDVQSKDLPYMKNLCTDVQSKDLPNMVTTRPKLHNILVLKFQQSGHRICKTCCLAKKTVLDYLLKINKELIKLNKNHLNNP